MTFREADESLDSSFKPAYYYIQKQLTASESSMDE
jgi:hypothetical protein